MRFSSRSRDSLGTLTRPAVTSRTAASRPEQRHPLHRSLAWLHDRVVLRSATLGLVMVIAIAVPARAASCPSVVGHYPYGPWRTVVAGEDAVYSGSGTVLTISTMSASGHLSPAGELDLGEPVYDLARVGDVLYIANGPGGLVVLDVSTPLTPRVVARYLASGSAVRVAAQGDLAFVTKGDLHILDVSDPTAPSEIGMLQGAGAFRDVDVSGSTAYALEGQKSLRAIDISNPATPNLLGVVELATGLGSRLTIANGYAYAATFYGGVFVVDVNDPLHPTVVGSLLDVLPTINTRDVQVRGDVLYAADSVEGLLVVDVADPTSPEVLNAYDVTGHGNAEAISLIGSFVITACNGYGLRSVDVGNPSSPRGVGALSSAMGRVQDVVVVGDRLFTAEPELGIRTLDISNPAAPGTVALYSRPGVLGLGVVGSLLLAAQEKPGGMAVYSIATGAPSWLASQSTGSSWIACQAVAATSTTAYMGTWSGLLVVDITNPSDPEEIGQLLVGKEIRALAVADTKLMVIAAAEGLESWALYVFDVTAPEDPQLLGSLGGFDFPQDVATYDQFVYVTDTSATSRVRVVDASDPTHPTENPEAAVESTVSITLAVVGEHLIVGGAGNDAVQILSLAQPSSPTTVATYRLDSPVYGLAASGSLVVAGTSDLGIYLLQTAGCAGFLFADGFDSGTAAAWSGQEPSGTATTTPPRAGELSHPPLDGWRIPWLGRTR